MHVGYKIKQLMDSKNMTVTDISKEWGKSRTAVYDIQEKPDINTSVLRIFAKILDVPMVYFFEDLQKDEKKDKCNEELITRKNAEHIKQLKEIILSKNETIDSQKETILSQKILIETKANVIKKYKKENTELRVVLNRSESSFVRNNP